MLFKNVNLKSSEPQILFESENYALLFKPYNFLSIRSRFYRENIKNSVPEENLFDYFDNAFLPVHRLDREVAGLVLVAKNSAAQSKASSYFERRILKKSYWALSLKTDLSIQNPLPFTIVKINNLNPEDSFDWKNKILRGKKRSYESQHGQLCQTLAQLKSTHTLHNYNIYFWELSPVTGRSHQLRLELAKHEHPIIGDALYFAPLGISFLNGIALCAVSLDFTNCKDNELNGVFKLDLRVEDFLNAVQLPSSIQVAGKE